MLKTIFVCSATIALIIQATFAYGSSIDEIISKLQEFESFKLGPCDKSSDCPNGFYCNNNDCVARKREGSFCFSGDDEECSCGKCVTNTETWTQSCFNDDGQCFNEGKNSINNCKKNSDCPYDYFCDERNGNICSSKLPVGRLCHSDDMCGCGNCVMHREHTRKGLKTIHYKTCMC